MDAPTSVVRDGELVTLEPAVCEVLLAALRVAVSQPGEHRLFRAGKLPGLFPQRVGPAAVAATYALQHGLLQITRRETRGKVVNEWVQSTPAAVRFVHDHDSPQAILREWKQLLALTSTGVPAWLEQIRQQLTALTRQVEAQTQAVLEQLHGLQQRLEAALRRQELDRTLLGEPLGQSVPWAADALEYLDQRCSTTAAPCPLPELFTAIATRHPHLDIPAFQTGLVRLDELRLVRLLEHEPVEAPEFALLHRGRLLYAVQR
ncbi:MAG: hypothetical protein NZ703_07350 [Gemmataceae bacterium]|nr:hypothetical protein [Gemmataceae bacterium]MCS7270884.1 hypothetical protein [Gemmataceae bacterium]MDW8241681.1 hypothetical protein [Thermogemmata sp.]